MTEEELAEWGRTENVSRQAEMATVNNQIELEAVQKKVRKRRNAVGLSASQATWWVRVGQRLDRGESLSFALRTR